MFPRYAFSKFMECFLCNDITVMFLCEISPRFSFPSVHLCLIELHSHPTGYMEIKCIIVNNSQNKILKHFPLCIPAKDQHKSFKRNPPPYHVVFDFLQDVIIGHNQFFRCCAICYIGKDTQCLKERKTGKLFGPRSHPMTASLTALNSGQTIPLISFSIFNLGFPACSYLGPMPRSYQLWGAALAKNIHHHFKMKSSTH